MTCPTCSAWCATSTKKLAIRLKNISDAPDIGPHPCPQCGGIDWAISTSMIEPEVEVKPWWGRLLPTRWHRVCALQLATAVFCVGLAVDSGPSLTGMVDTFLVGFNMAGALFAVFQIRMKRAFDQMEIAFESLVEMNTQLIAGQVEYIINKRDDDAPPLSLH